MRIVGPFNHGSTFLNGREVYFRNGVADVPDEIGNELIKRNGYRRESPVRPINSPEAIKLEAVKVVQQIENIKSITLMKHRDDIDVSIIVPTRNRLKDIQICVDSIYEFTKEITYEIIIVDGLGNAYELFKDHTPVVYIRDNENLGAAHAFNMGFMNAMGKWTVWLNDDVLVTKDWLKIALEFMEKNPKIGLGAFFFRELDETGNTIYYKTNSIYDGEYCSRTFAAWTIHSSRTYANFGILKTSLMKKLNYFDEKTFGCYACDTDFSHRVVASGLGVAPMYGSRIIHLNRQDENKKRNFEVNKGYHEDHKKYIERWSPK